ncbi:MAG: protein kinase [Pirellulaceae bacterium]|nr:protein kinase [Pirellulaceae bacterium]
MSDKQQSPIKQDPIELRRSACLSTVTPDGTADTAVSLARPNLGNPRYQLIEEIGHGGIGHIYSAQDSLLPRVVVVKILRQEHENNERVRRAFVNESRIMSFLSHPAIPTIFESGVCIDNRPFHVMDKLRGTTLQELLNKGLSTKARLLGIFADVCKTIAYAHTRGVIHLDLKPSNVIVGDFSEQYVTDWGLARVRDKSILADLDAASESPSGSLPIAGTPEYMSPEQARGDTLDARADVFALGAILCEILTGRPPYIGETVSQVYRLAANAKMQTAIDRLEAFATDLALIRLTKRCLAPNPDERPDNAVQVAQDVAAYEESALQQVTGDMDRFFDLSPDLFCIADLNGFFRRINSNFKRILGFDNDELLSKPFLNYVHPDDVEATLAQMAHLSAGKPVIRFRNRYRTVHGHYIMLEWTAKAIPEDQLIFAVARDVSMQ